MAAKLIPPFSAATVSRGVSQWLGGWVLGMGNAIREARSRITKPFPKSPNRALGDEADLLVLHPIGKIKLMPKRWRQLIAA
jgi:hypothetical protein